MTQDKGASCYQARSFCKNFTAIQKDTQLFYSFVSLPVIMIFELVVSLFFAFLHSSCNYLMLDLRLLSRG